MTEDDTFHALSRTSIIEIDRIYSRMLTNSLKYSSPNDSSDSRIAMLQKHGWTYEEYYEERDIYIEKHGRI